jgi:hypothetical protein
MGVFRVFAKIVELEMYGLYSAKRKRRNSQQTSLSDIKGRASLSHLVPCAKYIWRAPLAATPPYCLQNVFTLFLTVHNILNKYMRYKKINHTTLSGNVQCVENRYLLTEFFKEKLTFLSFTSAKVFINSDKRLLWAVVFSVEQ